MDNRVNEIRRRINGLRHQMAALEATIRDEINHDLDCTDHALLLMAIRAELTELIARWKGAGGGEHLPTVRLNRVMEPTRLLRGAAERRKKSGAPCDAKNRR